MARKQTTEQKITRNHGWELERSPSSRKNGQQCTCFKLIQLISVHMEWNLLIILPGLTLYRSVRVPLDVIAVTCRFLTVDTSSAREVSSWKWVANRQKQRILVEMYLKEKCRASWSVFNRPIEADASNLITQSQDRIKNMQPFPRAGKKKGSKSQTPRLLSLIGWSLKLISRVICKTIANATLRLTLNCSKNRSAN